MAARCRGPRCGGPVHVVQLAVKTAGTCAAAPPASSTAAAAVPATPGYGIKNLLARNLEHLTAEQSAKIIETLDASAAEQQAAAAWIAKEKLRDALNLRARVTGSAPCERNVRDRLFSFYLRCAGHDDIPELISLAKTISRRGDQIVCAVITGVTNTASESLSRLAELEARQACGLCNPATQRRRVRIARTRGTRRKTRAVTRKPARTVIPGRAPPG